MDPYRAALMLMQKRCDSTVKEYTMIQIIQVRKLYVIGVRYKTLSPLLPCQLCYRMAL